MPTANEPFRGIVRVCQTILWLDVALRIDEIRSCLGNGKWVMTRHARERAGKRRVEASELAEALAHGEILEDYSSDPRGPSALVLGHCEDGRPLHAVCALDPNGILLIITVYEPAPPAWIDERTRAGRA